MELGSLLGMKLVTAYQNYDGVMRNLILLEEDDFEKATTRCEAAGLRRQLNRFETVFMTVFWNSIL